jgi:predicted nucleic acid-binding Zn ribbon protein
MAFCSGCGTQIPDGSTMCADCSRSIESRTIMLSSQAGEFLAATMHREAGRIISHLWVIFVLLPVMLGILYALVTAK